MGSPLGRKAKGPLLPHDTGSRLQGRLRHGAAMGSSPVQAYTGISPELGARFHFIRAAPGGLWFGPTLSAG